MTVMNVAARFSGVEVPFNGLENFAKDAKNMFHAGSFLIMHSWATFIDTSK